MRARGIYEQPFYPYRLGGRLIEIQVLDPEHAFELEPRLVDELGPRLALAIAQPDSVLSVIANRSLDSSDDGAYQAAVALRGLLQFVSELLTTTKLDGAFIAHAMHTLLDGCVRIGGDVVEDVADLVRYGAALKWQLFTAQIAQTYGGIWTGEPYQAATTAPPLPIEAPKGTTKAQGWADALARAGVASSVDEVLRRWTPVRVIAAVTQAAFIADLERLETKKARAQQRQRQKE